MNIEELKSDPVLRFGYCLLFVVFGILLASIFAYFSTQSCENSGGVEVFSHYEKSFVFIGGVISPIQFSVYECNYNEVE